jgi:hypothetical protein
VAQTYAGLRPYLDERQGRLLLVVDAVELGRDGIEAVAQATGGLSRHRGQGCAVLEGGAEPSVANRPLRPTRDSGTHRDSGTDTSVRVPASYREPAA